MNEFREKHHYVSRSYLKPWSDGSGNTFVYRILVSDDSVPLWQKRSLKSIAYHRHLYTLVSAEADSDELERWMDKEIETPAQKVLNKIRSEKKLTKDEWETLLRYMALQDVRTPVRLMEHLKFMREEMPGVIEEVLKKSVHILENARKIEELPRPPKCPEVNMIPLRLSTIFKPNSEEGLLKAEIIAGRSTWLFSIRRFLNKTYKILEKHCWSVIRAPYGIEWLTSDNPVIKLNYYASGSYDFKGGWGRKGTEILFPLSPYLLLYTKVGYKTQYRDVNLQLARKIQCLIAENAHRFIFFSRPISGIEKIRPRIVNQDIFKYEKEVWDKWHNEQKKAELVFMKRDTSE